MFPDHCVNSPRNAEMSRRRLIPDVLNISHHVCFASSSSILIVRSIWAISVLTITDSRSPSAWYLTRISNASSRRSLLMRYRGLSGRRLLSGQQSVVLFFLRTEYVCIQNSADLNHGRRNLQKRRDSPRPVRRDGDCAQTHGSGSDLADEVG